MSILDLPLELLEQIFSNLSYIEIARLYCDTKNHQLENILRYILCRHQPTPDEDIPNHNDRLYYSHGFEGLDDINMCLNFFIDFVEKLDEKEMKIYVKHVFNPNVETYLKFINRLYYSTRSDLSKITGERLKILVSKIYLKDKSVSEVVHKVVKYTSMRKGRIEYPYEKFIDGFFANRDMWNLCKNNPFDEKQITIEDDQETIDFNFTVPYRYKWDRRDEKAYFYKGIKLSAHIIRLNLKYGSSKFVLPCGCFHYEKHGERDILIFYDE